MCALKPRGTACPVLSDPAQHLTPAIITHKGMRPCPPCSSMPSNHISHKLFEAHTDMPHRCCCCSFVQATRAKQQVSTNQQDPKPSNPWSPPHTPQPSDLPHPASLHLHSTAPTCIEVLLLQVCAGQHSRHLQPLKNLQPHTGHTPTFNGTPPTPGTHLCRSAAAPGVCRAAQQAPPRQAPAHLLPHQPETWTAPSQSVPLHAAST